MNIFFGAQPLAYFVSKCLLKSSGDVLWLRMSGQKTLIGRLILVLLRWNGAGVIYILDIAYNFRTAFIVVHNLRRSVVRDRVLIAEYYMRYSTFWPDLLAALPLVAEVGLTQMLLSPVVSWMFKRLQSSKNSYSLH